MTLQTKQRILGVSVIVAVFVALVPFFLNKPTASLPNQLTRQSVPPAPQLVINKETIETDSRISQAQDEMLMTQSKSFPANQERLDLVAQEPEKNQLMEKTDKTTANQSITRQPRQNIPKTQATTSWTVQLASFGNKENAIALTEKLKQQGFSAYIKEGTTSQGKSITRVMVGPEYDSTQAQQLVSNLEKAVNLKGLLLIQRTT